MRNVVWILVVVMAVIHQDFWWWDDTTLVFGFIPIGLFYHLCFSLAAGCLWAMAVKFAWPTHLEEWADELEVAEQANKPAATGEAKHV